MSNHLRGTAFRLPSDLDSIVRVYQDEPDPVRIDGMTVTTAPLSAVIDGVPITIWARVIRPA